MKSKVLNEVLEEIAQKLNKAISADQAKKMGLDKYLYLEYAAIYGGWRIVNVGINNGAHYGAFDGNGTEPRLKASEMYIKLRGILAGIEATNNA